MKKIFSFILSLILVFGFSGCSSFDKYFSQKKSNNGGDNNLSNDIATDDIRNISKRADFFQFVNGKGWYLAQSKEGSHFGLIDFLNSKIKTVKIPHSSEMIIIDFHVAKNNTIWVLVTNTNWKRRVELINYDLSGKEISKKTLNVYANQVVTDDQNNIYIICEDEKETKFMVLNPKGEKLFELPTGYYPTLFVSSDNQVNVVSKINNNQTISKVNVNNKKYVDSGYGKLSKDLQDKNYLKGTGKYSFFIVLKDKLVGYNIQNKNIEDVVNYKSNNISFDEIHTFIPINDNKMICILKSGDTIQNTEIEFKDITY